MMEMKRRYEALLDVLSGPCEAYALLEGSEQYPQLHGAVEFYPLWGGTLVATAVAGLPQPETAGCANAFHGFHIHEGSSCAQENGSAEAFPLSKGHFNPQNCSHPAHAGDLPPLLAANGFAFQIFYTDRFVPEEIIGRTVIIHSMADDFTTQPSGNSGTKIACGVIKGAWEM